MSERVSTETAGGVANSVFTEGHAFLGANIWIVFIAILGLSFYTIFFAGTKSRLF